MVDSKKVQRIGESLMLLAVFLVVPLLVCAQSNKKQSSPPPSTPPPQQHTQAAPHASAPAPPHTQSSTQSGQHPSGGHPSGGTGTGAGGGGKGTGTGAGGGGKGTGTGAGGAGKGTGTGAGGGLKGTGTGAVPARPETLTTVESHKQIEKLNQTRTTMTGVNQQSLPAGKVTQFPDGRTTIVASGGRQINLRKDGTVQSISLSDGRTATFHPNGTVSSVHSNGIQIDHNLKGGRTIVTERNGQRMVSTGAGQGYLQRPYVERNGRNYVQRTYVVNNTTYVSVYRTYTYRNVTYYNYVPVYYYQPVFYGWAYNPWPAPVYFSWGWYGDPWYAPYGYYFAPYSVYPSAAYWMTDYIISENLRAAYEAGAASANSGSTAGNDQPNTNSPALSPQVKEMIAEEVKAQIAAEREAAAQGATTTPPSAPAPSGGNSDQLPPALDPNLKVFIVTTAMDVTAEGQACSLSPGDVLIRTETSPNSENAVAVSVLSSQKSDCASGSATHVQVAALQEMHNHFREQMDNGLKTLAEKQGKAGLPSAPDVHTVAGEVPPPTADSSVAVKKINAQQHEADQSEKEIQQQAFTEKTS